MSRGRFVVLSGLISGFDQDRDRPSAEQLAITGYDAGRKDADGLTAGQIFYATVAMELEELNAWIAGFNDCSILCAGKADRQRQVRPMMGGAPGSMTGAPHPGERPRIVH